MRYAWDMSQLGERLSQRIRELRLERNLTQQELAVKAGLAVVTVARAEATGRPYALSTIEKIAVALDVPVAALFDDGETEADQNEAVAETAESAT